MPSKFLGFRLGRVVLIVVSFCITGQLAAEETDLDFLEISIDGTLRRGKPFETIKVVKGSKIRINSAALKSTRVRPKQVNLIGFKNPDSNNPGNDIGYEIDSAKGLGRKFSLNGKGKTYTVWIVSGSTVHGKVFLEIVRPKIDKVVIGSPRGDIEVANGQEVTIPAKTEIKVKEVQSNLDNQEYLKMSVNSVEQTANHEKFRIQFENHGIFAGSVAIKVTRQ